MNYSVIGGHGVRDLKCTVVIPTYNRPDYLKRILGYYNQYGSGLPIIVADSSSDENKKRNKETIASFQRASFSYLDKYDSNAGGYHKIIDALQQVSTEYCVLCADDDFITPSGIYESTQFLDMNPDYTMAYGDCALFIVKNNLIHKAKPYYKLYCSQANTYAESRDRLVAGVSNNSVYYYAVRHTSFTKMLFMEASKMTTSSYSSGSLRVTGDILFAEYMVTWLSAIYGKIKRLENLTSAKEEFLPLQFRRVGTSLREIMDESSYNDSERKFLDCISTHLCGESGVSIEESYKVAKECLLVWKKQHVTFMALVNRVMTNSNLPNWLDQGIREVYRTIDSTLHWLPYHPCIRTSKYYNDLNQINLCVLSNAKDIYGL